MSSPSISVASVIRFITIISLKMRFSGDFDRLFVCCEIWRNAGRSAYDWSGQFRYQGICHFRCDQFCHSVLAYCYRNTGAHMRLCACALVFVFFLCVCVYVYLYVYIYVYVQVLVYALYTHMCICVTVLVCTWANVSAERGPAIKLPDKRSRPTIPSLENSSFLSS